jgi:hypothetical protein
MRRANVAPLYLSTCANAEAGGICTVRVTVPPVELAAKLDGLKLYVTIGGRPFRLKVTGAEKVPESGVTVKV